MSWTDNLKIGVNRDAIRLTARLMGENALSEWPNFVLSFVLLAVVSVTTAATAYLMKDVVNSVFVSRDEAAITGVAALVAAVFLIKGISSYANAIVVARLSMRIMAKLQNRFFARLLDQGMDYFSGTGAGAMLGRFNHNAQAARGVIEMVAMTFWRDLFSLVALIIVMIVQSPTMALGSLMIGPPAVLGVMYLMRKTKAIAQSEAQQAGLILGVLKDTIDNIRAVKAYTLEDRRRDEMAGAIEKLQTRMFRLTRLSALTVPLMEILGGIAISGAILYGGYQVTQAAGDPGEFFSFITAFIMAYEPARRLARFNVDYQRRLIGVGMFYEMIDKIGADEVRPDAPDLAIPKGEIRFDQVHFAYGKAPALSGVDAVFSPGTMTALVGPSGAGKTTIFSLIERFYTASSGQITIDGQDISDVSLESLRRNIAIVTQDPLLFEGTIGENIRLGRDGATEEDMIAAAKAANAHGFIMDLPGGYDAQVGTAGGRLSGGQKQRVAIARALVRDAPILLLDEATSALDTLSEVAVQEALAHLAEGRTTIAIAHRLSTIFDADQILVMDRGEIVERGRHSALVGEGGLYAQLYASQVERMQRGET
ncbi:MAG: ABC transporter ATP-binding protein [Pseudomonadota bacterium]